MSHKIVAETEGREYESEKKNVLRYRVSEKKVLKQIIEAKKDEVKRDW